MCVRPSTRRPPPPPPTLTLADAAGGPRAGPHRSEAPAQDPHSRAAGGSQLTRERSGDSSVDGGSVVSPDPNPVALRMPGTSPAPRLLPMIFSKTRRLLGAAREVRPYSLGELSASRLRVVPTPEQIAGNAASDLHGCSRPIALHVSRSRSGWDVVLPESGQLVTCETLDDARRVAYVCGAHAHPCELVVRDHDHVHSELIGDHASRS